MRQQEPATEDTADLAVYTVGRLSHSELTGVDLVPADTNRHWEIVLDRPLVVQFDGECHVVGAGFRFDGASIRYRAVNAVIPRYGREILPAAAVHDWYYSDGRHQIPPDVGYGNAFLSRERLVSGATPSNGRPRATSHETLAARRLWCDDLFYRALRASGVNLVRARAAYRAVRMFGGSVWRAGEAAGFAQPSVTKQSLLAVGVRDYAREIRA